MNNSDKGGQSVERMRSKMSWFTKCTKPLPEGDTEISVNPWVMSVENDVLGWAL